VESAVPGALFSSRVSHTLFVFVRFTHFVAPLICA
jgi:hypothetical protein